jgi:hypothetical protein
VASLREALLGNGTGTVYAAGAAGGWKKPHGRPNLASGPSNAPLPMDGSGRRTRCGNAVSGGMMRDAKEGGWGLVDFKVGFVC